MRPDPAPGRRPSLAEAQRALLSLVTGPPAAEGALEAEALIAADERAGARARVALYAHMYRARLVEAVEAQFPRLARLLGPDAFAELVGHYVGAHPSRHPSLRFVGAHLPGWLAGQSGTAPAVAGLAALEWARTDVFDLADEETLTPDAARAWPAERFGELPLALLAAHRLVSVPDGTAALWDALAGEAGAHVPLASNPAREALVVWREGTAVYHRLVEPEEEGALGLVAAGTTFGLVCESLLARHDEQAAVATAHAWLCTWVGDGLLRAAC